MPVTFYLTTKPGLNMLRQSSCLIDIGDRCVVAETIGGIDEPSLVVYQMYHPKGTIIQKTKPFTDLNLVEK